MLEINKKYTRRDNIIYNSENIPILKLKLRFVDHDFEPFSESINYMNKYIQQNPHLVEIYSTGGPNKESTQLKIF